ncbi:hypothetical protein SAMN05421874_12946 [Nonomuraea maritima]|uniref:Right handed beta helix region n=1 Tax=Nonomuraea maritima TaxID=683260 RepID=A0A1G9N000_9ACTN|nr:hypothetical protein [Nonomuraea maritima]SDL79467.1 hypothetical protein SAMN05421874_12946 [Nonomuraea maritima]
MPSPSDRRPRSSVVLRLAVAVAVLSAGVALLSTGTAVVNSSDRSEGSPPRTSLSPAVSSSPSPGVPSPGSEATPSSERACPPPPAYPTPECTGVPPGKQLQKHEGDLVADEDGQVIDGLHITGNLSVEGQGVEIRDSWIEGWVDNSRNGPRGDGSFTITDSTVGRDDRCDAGTGVSESEFTATRVKVVGHGDAFGAGGDNVLIQDSFALLCGEDEWHSDGFQAHEAGRDVVIRHNTFDQRKVPASGVTAPVFISDGSPEATVVDNLLIGGSSTIRVHQGGERWKYVVTGNRVVQDAWLYSPVDSSCAVIETWADNRLVQIDDAYQVTWLGPELPCVDGS